MVAEVVELGAETKKRPISQKWVADSFAKARANDYAYCHDQNAWLEFDGAIWKRLSTPDVFYHLSNLSTEMSAFSPQPDKMQSAAFISGVERLAKSHPDLSRKADHWDRDSFLLGTPSMAVDLKTGLSRKAIPADMLTKTTAVSPDEFEDCPRWNTFLREATGGDEELITFLQRWAGYCLTGDVREQSLVFLWGPGGNGKGVFLNTLAAIMGDYAVKAAMETFTARKFDAHPTELARLHGSRLVYASETEEGRAWAEARLKELTGGDPITARFIGQNFFTFTPAFKLTFMGNLQPSLETADSAMKRRMCMVPFDRTPTRVDLTLVERMRPEWPGILRWAINGCVDWLGHGLPRPAAVVASNEDYFADQDMIAQWMLASCRCEPGNEHIWEKVSDLFASWCAFAKAAREPAGSMRGFSFKLQRAGYVRSRTKQERRMMGVSLLIRPDLGESFRYPEPLS